MTRFHIRRALIGALVLLPFGFVSAAHAAEVKAGDLVISSAWSRAMPKGAKVAAGYLTVENKGTAPDRLIAAETDMAAKGEVHEMTMKDGVMHMHPVEGGIVIAPGKTVKLAPGGYHLMFMDPKRQLKQGDTFNAVLTFEKAGKVTVPFDVGTIAAQAPAGGGSHMHMDHMKTDKKM